MNPTLPPVFIVGTGRCGSTLLSKLLRQHAAICSLSEFFVFATDLGRALPEAFPSGLVSGEHFWKILADPHPLQTLMVRQDIMMDEALYRPGPGRRWDASTGIPPIVATTLTHLETDPDSLFDELADFARALPPAPIGQQYQSLFFYLQQRYGAMLWVERSGGSLRAVRRLREHFPEARFVHILRDGRDTALSMSRHYGFRMAFIHAQLTEILGVDPFMNTNRRYADDLPDDLADMLPECFNAEKFRQSPSPVEMCGHYWSGEMIAGARELEGLPPESLLNLRYESILSEPILELEKLFAWLLPGQPVMDVKPFADQIRTPQSDWRALPETQSAALTRACLPGLETMEYLLSK